MVGQTLLSEPWDVGASHMPKSKSGGGRGRAVFPAHRGRRLRTHRTALSKRDLWVGTVQFLVITDYVIAENRS